MTMSIYSKTPAWATSSIASLTLSLFSSGVYLILSILTARKISVVRSRDLSYRRRTDSESIRLLPEDELQRQQLLRLLMSKDPDNKGSSPLATQNTFRIDLPESLKTKRERDAVNVTYQNHLAPPSNGVIYEGRNRSHSVGATPHPLPDYNVNLLQNSPPTTDVKYDPSRLSPNHHSPNNHSPSRVPSNSVTSSPTFPSQNLLSSNSPEIEPPIDPKLAALQRARARSAESRNREIQERIEREHQHSSYLVAPSNPAPSNLLYRHSSHRPPSTPLDRDLPSIPLSERHPLERGSVVSGLRIKPGLVDNLVTSPGVYRPGEEDDAAEPRHVDAADAGLLEGSDEMGLGPAPTKAERGRQRQRRRELERDRIEKGHLNGDCRDNELSKGVSERIAGMGNVGELEGVAITPRIMRVQTDGWNGGR